MFGPAATRGATGHNAALMAFANYPRWWWINAYWDWISAWGPTYHGSPVPFSGVNYKIMPFFYGLFLKKERKRHGADRILKTAGHFAPGPTHDTPRQFDHLGVHAAFIAGILIIARIQEKKWRLRSMLCLLRYFSGTSLPAFYCKRLDGVLLLDPCHFVTSTTLNTLRWAKRWHQSNDKKAVETEFNLAPPACPALSADGSNRWDMAGCSLGRKGGPTLTWKCSAAGTLLWCPIFSRCFSPLINKVAPWHNATGPAPGIVPPRFYPIIQLRHPHNLSADHLRHSI